MAQEKTRTHIPRTTPTREEATPVSLGVSNENFACELVDKLALWLVTAYSETMAGHAGLGVEEGRRPSMGSEKQLFTHM